MLKLNDIHVYYGESHVLHGMSLNVKEGSVVALVGRNGMGKTTTIRAITGLTPPRSGIISFKGKQIAGLPPYVIARMGISVVPQGRHIFRSLSVQENLTTSARTNGKTNPWTLEKIYARFPVLKERARIKGNMLSGGEQQMLSIGRALMTNPDLLLMDETSEGLAPVIVRDIARIINQIKQSGFSVLLVEQSLPLVLSVADYVYVICKGVVVYSSTPQEFDRNEEVKNKYLGVAG